MEVPEWVDFFKWNGGHVVILRYYESTTAVTVNELYDHFAQRMLESGRFNEIKESNEGER